MVNPSHCRFQGCISGPTEGRSDAEIKSINSIEEQAKLPLEDSEIERPNQDLGRELGTLLAIYPILNLQGDYELELQMSKDTVFVDFKAAKQYSSDSVGILLFRSKREPFYTKDETCLYSPKKQACLPFNRGQVRDNQSRVSHQNPK